MTKIKKTNKKEEPKKEFFSLQEVFFDAAEIDPSKDEIIDMLESPEKLIGVTGWKHLKIPETKKTAYFYFRNGKLDRAPVSFNKKFVGNLKALSKTNSKKIKNRKDIVSFFGNSTWEEFQSQLSYVHHSSFEFLELGFDKTGKVFSCAEDGGICSSEEEWFSSNVEPYHSRIFLWKDLLPPREVITKTNHSIYSDKKLHNAGNSFQGKVTFTEDYSYSSIWLKHGLLHREDGPARQHGDGDADYFLEGFYVDKANFSAAVKKYKEKELKINAARQKIKDLKTTKKLESKSSEKTELKPENIKENILKEFTKLSDVPDDFTGIAKWEGHVCHFKNGLLHREDGPAVEDYDLLNYAYEGMRLSEKEFENYKSFREKYYNVLTESYIKDNFPNAKETLETVEYLGGECEILCLDVENERYVFEPVRYFPQKKEFSKERAISAIEKFNKEDLLSSRTGPARINPIIGDMYFVDGLFFKSKKEWENYLKKERELVLSDHESAFEYEKVKQKIKDYKVFSSTEELLKAGGTGIIDLNNNNRQDIGFYENGKDKFWLTYIDKKLITLSKYENDRPSSKDGPSYMNFDVRSFAYAVDGLYLSEDIFCFRHGTTIKPPDTYFMELLQSIKPDIEKEKKETITAAASIVATKVASIAKNDAKEVAKRMAAEKISTVTQHLLAQILNKSNVKGVDKLKEFMASSKGKIIVKFVSSLVIDALKNNFDSKYKEILSEISTEFRIQSETDLTLEVIDVVKDVVSNIDVLQKLSNLDERIRIQIENYEPSVKELPLVKEETVELSSQKIPQFIN